MTSTHNNTLIDQQKDLQNRITTFKNYELYFDNSDVLTKIIKNGIENDKQQLLKLHNYYANNPIQIDYNYIIIRNNKTLLYEYTKLTHKLPTSEHYNNNYLPEFGYFLYCIENALLTRGYDIRGGHIKNMFIPVNKLKIQMRYKNDIDIVVKKENKQSLKHDTLNNYIKEILRMHINKIDNTKHIPRMCILRSISLIKNLTYGEQRYTMYISTILSIVDILYFLIFKNDNIKLEYIKNYNNYIFLGYKLDNKFPFTIDINYNTDNNILDYEQNAISLTLDIFKRYKFYICPYENNNSKIDVELNKDNINIISTFRIIGEFKKKFPNNVIKKIMSYITDDYDNYKKLLYIISSLSKYKLYSTHNLCTNCPPNKTPMEVIINNINKYYLSYLRELKYIASGWKISCTNCDLDICCNRLFTKGSLFRRYLKKNKKDITNNLGISEFNKILITKLHKLYNNSIDINKNIKYEKPKKIKEVHKNILNHIYYDKTKKLPNNYNNIESIIQSDNSKVIFLKGKKIRGYFYKPIRKLTKLEYKQSSKTKKINKVPNKNKNKNINKNKDKYKEINKNKNIIKYNYQRNFIY